MAFNIEFRKSGKTLEWEGSSGNLLDFAEENGIHMESGCRIGTCGSCKVKLISGTVTMETEEGLEDADKANGMILPCVAVPESDLVIEA
ncbi:MAG: 2Fe-2S iron-sulfur cluster binding domain-containing protein [Syntrophaceae bacterium]|nr:2Fe-2S iron-sulfur cluster binding domain-containing protein [Syntrophaceae bacterium]